MSVKKNLFIITLIISTITVFSQTITIRGVVIDKQTFASLPGATIIDLNTGKGGTSDANGIYSFKIAPNNIRLKATFVGYKAAELNFSCTKDTVIYFKLVKNEIEIQEVKVQAKKPESDFVKQATGSIELPIKQIHNLPALGGETDIIKALQLLPGVQTSGEGSVGLNVRGGNSNQNLILLDGFSIYNTAHLFGFLSVFNPDAVSKIKIMKGGFPAEFGGRLSSVIEIDLKNGEPDKHRFEGSLGLIAGRFTASGPILKNKTSYLISARSAYANLFLKAYELLQNVSKVDGGNIGFYDFNLKINHNFDNKTNLTAGFYSGYDKYGYQRKRRITGMYNKSSEEQMKWNSSVSYFKFQKKINTDNAFNAQISYSNNHSFIGVSDKIENYEDESRNTFTNVEIGARLNDFAGKVYYETQDFLPGKTKLGAEYINHSIEPSDISIENNSEFIKQESKVYTGSEYAFFIDYKQTIFKKLELNAGLRYSFYRTANFSYAAPEPRFSALYALSPNHSIKAAFTKNAQYMHMLSNFSVGMPNDAWVPVTETIPFQTAYQYNLGYSHQNTKINSDFGIELFYKTFNNQIDFTANLSLLTPYANWETAVAKNGMGRAKGIEFWWHKSFGDLNGWLAYTWSNSERKFDEINSGKWFPFKYDRRHDFSVTASYLIINNLTVSATWVFATGNAITLPVGIYEKLDEQGLNRNSVLMYSDRNMERMPTYHRLDLGARYTKKKKWGELSYCFDIYNAYNRQNAYYFRVENYGDGYRLYQRSLFPILPTAGIEFKF